MKKYIFAVLINSIMAIFTLNNVQAQSYGSWVLPFEDYPNDISAQLIFGQDQIQTTTLKDNFIWPSAFHYSAGGYGQNGDLLFYIIDKQVYDAGTNSSIDVFHNVDEDKMKPEVQVINQPGNPNLFYIIFSHTLPGGNGVLNDGGFFYSEVLVDPYTQQVSLGNIYQKLPGLTTALGIDPGAFAISGLNSNDERILYRCTIGGGIIKNMITATGFDPDVTQVLDPDNPIIGASGDFDAYNFEMKINNAGHTVFAWTTMYSTTTYNDKDKVFIYDMDASSNPVKKIDIDPNTTGKIGGIEFSNLYDNVLYVSYNSNSSGSGLIKLNYENETTTMVNSGNFSHTFLQHSPDGNIYGVSDDGIYLGRIDDRVDGSFSPSYYSNGAVLSYIDQSGTFYYVLPENDKAILTMETSSENIACEGNSNGSATASVFGGEEPYTYVWTNNAGEEIGTTPDISGLGQGLYTCCVTDSDSPPAVVCQTIQISVDNNLLPFDYFDERIVAYNPANPVTNWSQSDASGFYRMGIRVEAGQTLNIAANSLLEFHEDATIVVEPGATLNIESSTLTNYAGCPYRWKGIQVWGNAEESQYVNPQNGIQYQGKLVINNSLVEHALVAVDLWKPGDYSKTGGIVLADNTTFRNNSKALHAIDYQNINFGTGKAMDNISYFDYCIFELNNEYMNDVEFYKHVDLASVDGIKFRACTFSLMDGVQGVNNYNEAIFAYNAGFDVMHVCTTPPGQACTTFDPCTFTGFYKGIYAFNSNSVYTFTVNRAVFTGNETGIYASNVQNLSVLFSDFNIAKGTGDVDECEGKGAKASGYGIDMTGCTGFAIEENHFAPSATAGTTIGIRIAETEATDEIYKNTFDGLSYGNYAVGENWTSGQQWKGLAYYCNENTGNWRDFNVSKNSEEIGGIQDPIGSTQMTAGNTFTDNANTNFYNDGNYWIGYYYYAPTPGNTNTPYYPDAVYRVTREEVVGIQNTCPSHYGGGGGSGSERGLVLTPEEKQEAELEFATGLSDYNNVKNLYENLKDGGNTTSTVADIETAWPQDMWELRAELLGKSPHLSMDVLKSAADKTNVLPDNVIFEIMAANPDELKKDELIKYLEDKENPLPEYMVDILKQVATGSTYKTVLQRQMAYYNQLKTRAAYDIVRSLLNDSVTDNNELRNWLDNIGGKRADEQIIALYMSEDNFSNALSLAAMMPSLYNYSGIELTEHEYYTDMLNLQINLAQQGRTIYDLDSTEIANLDFIAENSTGTAGSQAKGILEFAYGFHYCNCIGGDTTGYKSSGNFNYDAFRKAFGPDVEVNPNPAGEWTSFNYSLQSFDSEAVIKISDVNGKIIETFVVSGTQGQKVWDTRKINNGVYFYTFEVNGLTKSGKIVISK